MGERVGKGLTSKAAADMGLSEGTAVSVSIIDAHAGGIGMLGLHATGEEKPDFDRRLALIGGTSSCHMAVSKESRFISGVWGPYFSAMVPGFWLNEGGQSATGALVDHIIFNHAASAELAKAADQAKVSPYEFLNERLREMGGKEVHQLTRDIHVCPYFHGNRSPRANPHLKGMISGLKLSAGLDDLALLYLATVQAIAYGTRHIVETMDQAGYKINTVIVCGGGIKNPVFLRQHADCMGRRLIVPKEPEAVLLGSAILGAVAAGVYPSIPDAMAVMSQPGEVVEPDTTTKSYHDAKYKVFHSMYEHQMSYAARMA
jgi:FGGY-family pentulose kinase